MKTADECFQYLWNKNVDIYKILDAAPDKRLVEPMSILSTRDMMNIDVESMSGKDISYLADKIFMNGIS